MDALDRMGFGADLSTFRSLFALGELLDPYAPTSMPPYTSEDPIFLVIVALVVLLLLGSVAVPWRWEVVGGVVLVLEGLLGSVVIRVWAVPRNLVAVIDLLATLALPPFVAGSMFLASWWRTRTSGIPQEGADEGG